MGLLVAFFSGFPLESRMRNCTAIYTCVRSDYDGGVWVLCGDHNIISIIRREVYKMFSAIFNILICSRETLRCM